MNTSYDSPRTLRSLAVACMLAVSAICCGAAEQTPFSLPVSARIDSQNAEAGGWKAVGEMDVSFQQAQAQLASRISAAGWSHMHTIRLDKDRVLDAWRCGGRELTVMVWRISAGRSGFSYGLTSNVAGRGCR